MKVGYPTLIALIISITMFSFTRQILSEGLDCNSQLYWFKVAALIDKPCRNVQINELILTLDNNNNEQPDEVLLASAIEFPFGCSDIAYACALAYNINQLECVQIGSNFYFRPKQSEIHNFKCCSYKG